MNDFHEVHFRLGFADLGCSISTTGHQAQKVFHDDVHQTYSRIRERAKEITSERETGIQDVEQIQLQALDPNSAININIPALDSVDPGVNASRQVFESFPPGLRRALECGSLDEVNKVLGKMSVEEAEEIVGQLGEVVILHLSSFSCAEYDIGWNVVCGITDHRCNH